MATRCLSHQSKQKNNLFVQEYDTFYKPEPIEPEAEEGEKQKKKKKSKKVEAW